MPIEFDIVSKKLISTAFLDHLTCSWAPKISGQRERRLGSLSQDKALRRHLSHCAFNAPLLGFLADIGDRTLVKYADSQNWFTEGRLPLRPPD